MSYAAGAVRLSALSHLRVLYVATHDSIGLGEDGPTHQPVETAAWLRAMPNLAFWRPADGNETSATYLVAILSQHTPSVMAFSRQNVSICMSLADTASSTRQLIYREGHQGWLHSGRYPECRCYHRLHWVRDSTLLGSRAEVVEQRNQGATRQYAVHGGFQRAICRVQAIRAAFRRSDPLGRGVLCLWMGSLQPRALWLEGMGSIWAV